MSADPPSQLESRYRYGKSTFEALLSDKVHSGSLLKTKVRPCIETLDKHIAGTDWRHERPAWDCAEDMYLHDVGDWIKKYANSKDDNKRDFHIIQVNIVPAKSFLERLTGLMQYPPGAYVRHLSNSQFEEKYLGFVNKK